MTINHELVTRKLLLVVTELEPLGAIAPQGRSAYLASEVNQAVVERRLQRMAWRTLRCVRSGEPPGSRHRP